MTLSGVSVFPVWSLGEMTPSRKAFYERIYRPSKARPEVILIITGLSLVM